MVFIPWYKYHVLLSLFILHTLHPALEDGTDRGFRNVSKPQSDAGEIPKRIHRRVNTVDSIACPHPHGVSTHLFHENSAVEGDEDKSCYRL